MRTEQVEIYSDATNAAVIRHPGRRFPGTLIQGDSLFNLSRLAKAALAVANPNADEWDDLRELAEDLQARVDFYRRVLREHDLALPFSDPED